MWVQRDGDRIIGVYAQRQPGIAEEWVEGAVLTETREMVEARRRAAYAVESDPLLASWQAALATDASDRDERRAAWLAARAAIQARLPYPT